MALGINAASEQLDRTLAFFPRVDGKASGLFAINSAMLGVLAARFEPTDLAEWYTSLSAALTTVALVYSFTQLYLCAYPQLKGGGGSYVYFQSIASRTESNFVDDFTKLEEKEWMRDLTAQIWRNSEILSAKYAALRHAFTGTLIALIPWALVISFTGFES
jgi:Pycsar effector protein